MEKLQSGCVSRRVEDNVLSRAFQGGWRLQHHELSNSKDWRELEPRARLAGELPMWPTHRHWLRSSSESLVAGTETAQEGSLTADIND